MKPILRPKSKKDKDKDRAEETQSGMSSADAAMFKKQMVEAANTENKMVSKKPRRDNAGRVIEEKPSATSSLKKGFKSFKKGLKSGRDMISEANPLNLYKNNLRRRKENARAGEFAGDDVTFPRKMKKGGKVRGSGIAIQGVRAARMV